MTTGPTAFHTILSDVITEMRSLLIGSLGGDVGIACVVPGDIAIDTCDCGGSLWATLHAQFFSDSFPSISGQSACSAAYVVGECELMIARCAPIPQDETLLVSCTQLDTCSAITDSDAWILLNGLACILQGYVNDGTIIDYLVNRQVIVGPSGGCVGSSVSFSIALDRSLP